MSIHLYHPSRPKFGFMIDSLEPSELTFRIMMDSMGNHDFDVIFFWDKLSRGPISHLNSNMHWSEAYGFNHPIIATSLKMAYHLLKLPSPRPKFFFINDIEWIRFPQKQYEALEKIYRNPEFKLIARCEDHKVLIENCWNVKIDKIVESYDFINPDFLDYMQKHIGSIQRIRPKIDYKPIMEYF